MRNLAGDENCDQYIPHELELADIPYHNFGFKVGGEVPTTYKGFLDGWNFERAWYYWIARSDENLLLFKYANRLHKKFGKEVRVGGHCGCPSPKENYNRPWDIGVSLYHVDTQEGLLALANMIKQQTKGCR